MNWEAIRGWLPSSVSPDLGRTLYAPFSLYSRYMVRSYVRHTFLVTFVLLSVILTIELSPWITRILAESSSLEGGLVRLGRFAVFRTTDILAELLFMTFFLGVLWSEIDHTRQGERTPVLNSGRSPLQCLIPVIIFGVPMGFLQFALDSELRPLAVMQMATENLGGYAGRFPRSGMTGRFWLTAGQDVVQTEIGFDPPRLRDVLIYRRAEQGALTSVVAARGASPTSEPGVWLLREGSQWQMTVSEDQDESSRNLSSVQLHEKNDGFDFGSGEFNLNLDPLWLNFFNVEPKYIRQPQLLELARSPSDFYDEKPYSTEVAARYAHAFIPLALGVLATSLSLLLLSSSIRLGAVIGIALVGYLIGLILIRVLSIMGGAGDLPPLVAGWLAVGILLAISAAAIARKYSKGKRNNNVASE